MATRYELRTFSAAGVPRARLVDFGPLACTVAVNQPGRVAVRLRGDQPALLELEHRSHVEVWRSDPGNGIAWHRFFGGLYLKQNWSQPEEIVFQLTAPGYLWLLSARIVNWPANTPNRSAFVGVAGETLLKTLVDTNAGPNATLANGRKRTGTLAGLSIEADGGRGTALDWYCFGENLLETLQQLAPIAGGDFDLVKTGANTFQFRWFSGQRGTDRTGSVIFAVERGNLKAPLYEEDRIGERTVACVWGHGEGSERDYVTRTGPDWDAGRDTEVFVDARDLPDGAVDALNARGDQRLQTTRSVAEFQYEILQTPGCTFEKHYFLGDLVTLRNPFTGSSSSQKISAVTIGLDEDGRETITPELSVP